MESIQSIKQRFEIIGNDQKLNRAIEKSIQVAPTDISVLVTGESGVGKESIPKIIHSLSHRKHAKYIAVNCGAIPEGTIDSELFGHEKGAFTEEKRSISAFTLNGYLPSSASSSNLPAVVGGDKKEGDFSTEREILYKVLFDMKANDEKETPEQESNPLALLQLPETHEEPIIHQQVQQEDKYHFAEEIQEEETLSLQSPGSIFEPGMDRDFTLALQDRIQNQTSLDLVNNGKYDLLYEGEIVEYRISPMSATASQTAAQNRLSIAIQVRFTNNTKEDADFDQRFSFFFDYPADSQLSSQDTISGKTISLEDSEIVSEEVILESESKKVLIEKSNDEPLPQNETDAESNSRSGVI
ncbi:Transcriptional regulatory protein FlbD [Nymphon striatum]|nr:Transcriptional regulatory protein FlbD [Nymphon striatum]